ncbi:DoxX family protein [Flavitalea flava]
METTTIPKAQLWTGRIMSGIVILFMLFDAIIKFLKTPQVIDATVKELGFKEHHILLMAFLSLIPALLYMIPRTAVLGAVLLTGLYGGAITANLRVDNPLFSHNLFPVYLGILMWGGIWLRSPKLQALLPVNR